MICCLEVFWDEFGVWIQEKDDIRFLYNSIEDSKLLYMSVLISLVILYNTLY